MALAAAVEPPVSSSSSVIEISDVEEPTPVANEPPAVVQPLATTAPAVSAAAEQPQDPTADAVSDVTSAAKDLSVASPDASASKPEPSSIEKENDASSVASSRAEADAAAETAPASKPESEGTESEDAIPTRRVTRNRASLVRVQESDTESESAPRQRTRRQRSQSTGSAKTTTPSKTGKAEKEKKKKKAGRKPGRRGRKPAAAATNDDDDDSDDDGTPGEYVPVEVGDCVLLDSGDPDNHFIALVSSVQRSQNFVKQPGTFTAQWYYKPDDVRPEVRALIPGGVLEHEVFLSPHKDKNSIDAVIGLCHVVSPDEFAEVESEVKRGFRDATTKPYYICRYKYYPGRSVKKALEAVKNDAIRSGLGPMKPKVGDAFQATVPAFEAPPPSAPVASDKTAALPWSLSEASAHQYKQVWSPLAAEHQSLGLHAFLSLLKPLRFSIGNVVTLFRRQDALVPASGHVRAIVLAYDASDHVRICLSTGDVVSVLPSELCSPLTDDVALTSWYRARFSLSAAIAECTAVLARAQSIERDAFRMEVVTFSQLAAPAKQSLELSTDDDDDDDDDEEDASASESDASPVLLEDDDDDDDSHANTMKRVRSMRKRRK